MVHESGHHHRRDCGVCRSGHTGYKHGSQEEKERVLLKTTGFVLAVLLCLLIAVLSPQEIQADEGSAEVTLTVNIVSGPTVFTCSAIGVGTTKATLRGWLADLGTAPSVLVSFGWDTESHAGDSDGYANWTVPQVKTRTGFFKTRIEGLTPGTTYYFRAKAVGDVIIYGQELSFQTQPGWNWLWYWLSYWY